MAQQKIYKISARQPDVVRDFIVKQIRTNLDIDDDLSDMSCLEEIGVGSLDRIILINDIENEFDVRLLDQEINTLVTIGDLVNLTIVLAN